MNRIALAMRIITRNLLRNDAKSIVVEIVIILSVAMMLAVLLW